MSHYYHRALETPLTEASRLARLAAAWALYYRTNQPQNWIADQVGLHRAANVSQQMPRE